MAAEGVATKLPPYLSIPIEFIAQSCLSNPPKFHCTKAAAIKAAKTDVISYVKKHALTTILSLFEWDFDRYLSLSLLKLIFFL